MDTPGGAGAVLNLRQQSSSRRGYDRLAAYYRTIEWFVFGNRLQRARVVLLDALPPWRRMLIVGDGDGRLLYQICTRLACENPNARASADYKILSVDQSENMLRQQQLRLRTSINVACVEYLQCDARAYLPPPSSYDLLVTPFFLDCFSQVELETCLPGWLAGLRPGGTLYHVDFVLPAGGWHRPAGKILIAAMHLFFRWQTGLRNWHLIDPQPYFSQYGLRKVVEHTAMGGLVSTQIWTKLSVTQQRHCR